MTHFPRLVKVNQTADQSDEESEAGSSGPDREELIRLAEEEVLAIETQYDQVVSANPSVVLSDISENSELTNELADEETNL